VDSPGNHGGRLDTATGNEKGGTHVPPFSFRQTVEEKCFSGTVNE